METVTDQIRAYLQYVALQFVSNPDAAELRIAEVDPSHISFRLIANPEDVGMLIGKNGFTASAIRNVLRAAAEREKIQVSLRIESREDSTHPH